MIIRDRDLSIAKRTFYDNISFWSKDSSGNSNIDIRNIILAFRNTFFLLVNKGFNPLTIDEMLRRTIRCSSVFNSINLRFMYEGLFKTLDEYELLTFKSYLSSIVEHKEAIKKLNERERI